MKDKYTPGPKKVALPKSFPCVVGSKLLVICGTNPRNCIGEREANANLIAAAPDLLEALMAACEYMRHIPLDHGGDCPNKWEAVEMCECGCVNAYIQAQAAIAKATGGDTL